MTQKNVTLSLNDNIYEKYKKYCRKKGVALSRSVEIFMEEKLNEDEP